MSEDKQGTDNSQFVDNNFIHTMEDDLQKPLITPAGASQPSGVGQHRPEERPLETPQPPMEKTPLTPYSEKTNQGNPFLGQVLEKNPSQVEPKKAATETKPQNVDSWQKPPVQPREELKKEVQIVQTSELAGRAKFNWFVLSVVVLIILILFTGGLGGYYYWKNNLDQATNNSADTIAQENTSTDSQEIIIENNEPTEVVEINSELEKFSSENANILSFDVESVTSEQIKERIKQAATEVSSSKIEKAVEFVFTDQNNNRIAFARFAVLTKLTLPPQLLANTEEDFSLYLFNDAGKTRAGLSILTKNKDVVFSEMLKAEGNLVSTLTILFLDEKIDTSNAIFKDGKYQDTAVRYKNLNPENTLSIDYTIKNQHLLIGTSQKTLHAIFDKN